MTNSLLGILNTGRLGISANQTAMSIIGNNIANVNTPGYTRQRPDMEALTSNGVTVDHIERLRDDYLANRLQDANTGLGGSSVLETNLKSIEALMNETDDSGISNSIRKFFNSLQDLTLQPSGTTERDTVRASGNQLSVDLNGLASQLRQLRSQIDEQLSQSVDRVNAITGQIAQLNQKIAQFSTKGDNTQQADMNMVLDQRDELVNELSSFVPVHVLKNTQGQATIFAGNEVLVEGGNQNKLATVIDPANDGHSALTIVDPSGTARPLSAKLTQGSLSAMLQVRDDNAGEALGQIERMTATLIQKVNVQHRAGTGLDGVSGRDFFQGLAANATSSWQNKGGATVTNATITDDTQLTFNDYEIRFSAAGQYDVVDTTTGAAVSTGNAYNPGSAINIAGMAITISNTAGIPAAGDTFRVNAYSGTTARMGLSQAVTNDSRAIAAGQGSAAGDNRNASALAGLLDTAVMGNPPTQTLTDFYNQVRVKIATTTKNAETDRTSNEITQQQIQGMVDGISGVSLDEEASKIIQYQRGFDAASRVIRVTDELMQSLLGMIG